MRLARPIGMAILSLVLAAYSLDCDAATTPEQAIQCCKSMPCSSHGHRGQDCCKTMPTMRAPFVQPPSVQGIHYSPVSLGMVPRASISHDLDSSSRVIAAHCHAP